jgi:multidrug efflux pump subunit AcrA (membrane-fusion protein)
MSSSGAHAAAPAPEPPAPLAPRPLPPLPEKPGARGWWLGALAIVILVGVLAYWQRQAFEPAAKRAAAARMFRTAKARTGSLNKSVRIAGVTAAERFSVLLAPQMRGTRGHSHGGGGDFSLVLQKLVPAGSHVKKGDVVAEFDRQFMLLRLDDYKSMSDQHERNVVRLKAYLTVRRAGYEQQVLRAKGEMEKAAVDLKKAPILSAINTEKYRLNYEEAKAAYDELHRDLDNVMISEGAAVKAAELDMGVARMEYARAERNANTMLVKAPIDGMAVMMTTRRSGESAQIQVGDQIGSGQPYMRIVDLSKMVVDASVNQVDAQMVHLGMPATVHFDAYPEVELPARVTSVGAFAQSGGWRGTYVRSVPIRLKLEAADSRVIPDLSVSADLVLGQTDNATIVPREAVFGDEAQPYAFVREPDGGWEKRPLDVVMTSNTAVAVRSGVNPGDVLAAEWPGQESGVQTRN